MAPQFCTKCGTILDENGHCSNPNCEEHSSKKQTISSEKSNNSFGQFNKKSITYSEKDKLIVPDCIASDIGEKPIRQYDIARLQSLIKGSFAEGRLQITNKRVLFRSAGNSLVGPTNIQQEFSIEEIAGIEIRKEAGFNLFATFALCFLSVFLVSIFQGLLYRIYSWGLIGTIALLLIAAFSVISYFIFNNKKFIRHIVLSIMFAGVPWNTLIFSNLSSPKTLASLIIIVTYVLGLIALAFAPNLVIAIKTKGGTSTIEIRKKDGLFSRNHNDYTGFSQVMPGPDVEKAMHELGALIREIQHTGDYVEK